MASDDAERAADVIGDAIAEAVRKAVDEVGRAPLAEIGDAGKNGGGDETGGGSPGEDDVPQLLAPDVTAADPYVVLGVARSAPWQQIVAAHKRLARAWHPDAGGDEDAIRRLNAAFAELRVRRGR